MPQFFARALAIITLVISCQTAYAADCALSPTTPCGALQDDAIYHSNLTLGVPANSSFPGSINIANGSASGVFVTIDNLSATTAYNFNLPATAGTSSYLLTSAGGASSSMTWTSPTVEINGVNCTLGSVCTITASAGAITVGVTTISGATSGYVLYNNGGSLGNYSVTGTAGSVVLSTSPSISGLTVTGSFTATGLIGLSALATQAANTIVGNATALAASPTALSIGSCSTASSALQWTTSSGFGCNTSITASAVPAANLTIFPRSSSGWAMNSVISRA